MKNLISLSLSFLLFLCIFPMPYWYYQLVKIFASAGFAYFAYQAYKAKDEFFQLAFALFAIVFFPLFKISFGRSGWLIVDLLAAALLLFSIGKSFFSSRSSRD